MKKNIGDKIRSDIVREAFVKNRCQKCKSKHYLTLHHIIPVEEGGIDCPENCITLCFKCHNKVHKEKKNDP